MISARGGKFACAGSFLRPGGNEPGLAGRGGGGGCPRINKSSEFGIEAIR